MNTDMKRLRYEKPEAGLIQLNSPLNLLVLFSAVDTEVDQFGEGEDLDVIYSLARSVIGILRL